MIDKSKLATFFLLLGGVWGAIWTLMEPLSLSKFLPPYLIDNWWLYQIAGSFIIATGIFIYRSRRNDLQTFGFDLADTKLDSCFEIIAGHPCLTVITDGYYGDVLTVSGDINNDAMDVPVQPVAQRGKKFTVRYQPDNYSAFILYLRLELITRNGSKPQLVWLALRTDITRPSGTAGQNEMAYPLNGQPDKNGWLISRIDIPGAVRETFGKQSWQYNKTVALRIRGKVKIQKFIIG